MSEEMAEVEEIEIVEEIESNEAEESEAVAESEQDEDQDEIVVSIGEEAPPTEETRAPEWVRELRKANREKDRKIRELESRLTSTEKKPVPVGAKPSLEDYDYDTDRYETALSAWFDRKRIADAESERIEQSEKAQREAWNRKLESYGKARAELKVRDFDDAEGVIQELFNITQQGIVLQGAENPALVVYALGKNPSKAKELSSITDPVKFAFAVSKLESQLKVSNRKSAPPPEKVLSGTGRASAVDSTLERLRADAEKTGDYTKVTAYKRQKKQAK